MPRYEKIAFLPKTLQSGEEFVKTFELEKYDQGVGWELRLIGLNALGKFELISVGGSGTTYPYDIPALPIVKGRYNCQAVIVDTGPPHRQVLIWTGFTEVFADYFAVAAGAGMLDDRSKVQQTFEALEDFILGKTSKDVQEYTIAGRTLKSYDTQDIIRWRNYYQHLFQRECKRQRIREGRDSGNTIRAEFKKS